MRTTCFLFTVPRAKVIRSVTVSRAEGIRSDTVSRKLNFVEIKKKEPEGPNINSIHKIQQYRKQQLKEAEIQYQKLNSDKGNQHVKKH